MTKRVLDVGNCAKDHGAIRQFVAGAFHADVVQADDAAETLGQLRAGRFDLVLVNRKLDKDYSDGLEIIRQIKADPELSATPAMLVTNYPEHQDQAVAVGAERGFGKRELHLPETFAKLSRFLAAPALESSAEMSSRKPS